jgi:AraC-like DNA-binding protein
VGIVVADEPERTWEFVTAPPRSAPGVTSMVGYRALETPGELHRGMPSSTLTFIVSLDDGVEAAESADALPVARPNPLVLGGLQTQAAHVRQRRGQAGVQLAVHPLAARALFGMPSAELSPAGYDGSVVLGRRGRELVGRVGDATDWHDAFSLIADYLVAAREGRGRTTVRPEVAYAWHLLERSRGRASMGAVADRVGLSPRHLATLFRGEVGRSPKTVAMLMRFERATARIAEAVRRRGPIDLAAIATDTGYSDQAHLSREFVRFAGTPPRRWVTEEFRNIQDGGHSFGSHCEHDCSQSDCVDNAASS